MWEEYFVSFVKGKYHIIFRHLSILSRFTSKETAKKCIDMGKVPFDGHWIWIAKAQEWMDVDVMPGGGGKKQFQKYAFALNF